MLPVPYGPVGSIGLAVPCGATVVGDRLHVAVRYSTKKCQCVMQDLRVLAHAVWHHDMQPHILCCRPRPSSMPISTFVGVLMARSERLRAPPSSLALFFSTTPAGGMHRAAPQDLVAQWAPCVPWERAGGLQVLDLAEQSQIGILG